MGSDWGSVNGAESFLGEFTYIVIINTSGIIVQIGISDKIANEIQENYFSKAFRYIESAEKHFTESALLNTICYLFCDGNDGDINSIKEILKEIKSTEKKLHGYKLF